MRLKNLPQDAALGIQVESSGPVDVILIHGHELKRFPAAVSPEFQGSVDRKLSFGVAIPKVGAYYVILDNRQHTEARKVRILIRAERGKNQAVVPLHRTNSGGKKKETQI